MKTKHKPFYSKLHLEQLTDSDYINFFNSMTDFDRDVIESMKDFCNFDLYKRYKKYERKEKLNKLNNEASILY